MWKNSQARVLVQSVVRDFARQSCGWCRWAWEHIYRYSKDNLASEIYSNQIYSNQSNLLSILNLLSRFRIDKMISFTTCVQTILCWNSSQSLQNRTFDCRCSWCSKLLFLLFGWSLSFPLSWWNLQRRRPFGDAEFHENRHLYTPLWDNWSCNLLVCVVF